MGLLTVVFFRLVDYYIDNAGFALSLFSSTAIHVTKLANEAHTHECGWGEEGRGEE